MSIYMYTLDIEFAKEHIPLVHYELMHQVQNHAEHARTTHKQSTAKAAFIMQTNADSAAQAVLDGEWDIIQHDLNFGVMVTEAVTQVRRAFNVPRP